MPVWTSPHTHTHTCTHTRTKICTHMQTLKNILHKWIEELIYVQKVGKRTYVVHYNYPSSFNKSTMRTLYVDTTIYISVDHCSQTYCYCTAIPTIFYMCCCAM